MTNYKTESYIIISLIQILFTLVSSVIIFNKLSYVSITSVLLGQVLIIIPTSVILTLCTLMICESYEINNFKYKLYSNIELFICIFITNIINFIYIILGVILIFIIGVISNQIINNSYIIITIFSIIISVISLIAMYIFVYSYYMYIERNKSLSIISCIRKSVVFITKYKYKIINMNADIAGMYINLSSLIITYSSMGIIIAEIYNNSNLFTLNIFTLILISSIQIIILCTQLSYLNIILGNKKIYRFIEEKMKKEAVY